MSEAIPRGLLAISQFPVASAFFFLYLFLTCLTFPPAGGVSAMLRNFVSLALVLLASFNAFGQASLLPRDRSIEQAFDHYIDEKLREEKITPAPAADDATI